MKSTRNSVKTIADIAKLAGVSTSTVSRALNDSPLISKETKERIRAIAEEHNYEVHRGARNLRLKQSRTITLLAPTAPQVEHFVTKALFVDLLRGIIIATSEYDYALLIGQPRKHVPGDIQRFIGLKQTDGLIAPAYQPYIDQIAEVVGQQIPVILWGSAENHRYCSVDCDNVRGGRIATEHLLEVGRQRIAFLGGYQHATLEVSLRYQGYVEALQEAGHAADRSLCVYGDYTRRSGYEGMQKLLVQAPDLDAVFVCSDLMAIGAMEALRESGRHVPQDISIVGFDDIAPASCCSPPLTTIRQNAYKIGEMLIHNLVQYLKDTITTTAIVPVELIVRKSSDPRM
jgi:DNA-binding LacI/PurR family transcriptional regulator